MVSANKLSHFSLLLMEFLYLSIHEKKNSFMYSGKGPSYILSFNLPDNSMSLVLLWLLYGLVNQDWTKKYLTTSQTIKFQS